jgi:hypothetical protein
MTGVAALFDTLRFTKSSNINSTDLDDLSVGGWYDGSNLTNAPNGSTAWWYVHVHRHTNTNGFIKQTAYSLDGGEPYGYYIRHCFSGAWSAWRKIFVGGGVDQAVGTAPWNFSLAVSASGSVLTVALKDAAGNNPSASSPVGAVFRSSTLTTGVPVYRAVTGALSQTLSSGSTAGVVSATAFRVWVALVDDGGTMRLALSNRFDAIAGVIYSINEQDLISCVSEGGAGAADSAGVWYSGATVTDKAFKVLGFVEWNTSGLTAGTWTTTNLLKVQGAANGVKLPGQIINVAFAGSVAGSNTTSATYVDVTGASIALTMSSAANVIEWNFRWGGTIAAGGAGTNSVGLWRVLRGASVLSGGTGSIGVVSGAGTNMQTHGFGSGYGIEIPNSISAQTFKLQHSKSSTGTPAVTSADVVMSLKELMT